MKTVCLVLAWSLAGVGAGELLAAEWYVNNRFGDDRWDGRSASAGGGTSGPCRTIRRALSLAGPGDRVNVANTGEPYRECLTLQAARHSGLPDRPFQLVGNGAILDGSAEVPVDAWEHATRDVYRFQPPRMAHQMLYLDGRPANRRPTDQQTSTLPSLEPLEWCLFDRHLYFRCEPGKVPRQYVLRYTAEQAGITLYEVRHVTVMDLIVQGFQLDGINAHDGVFDGNLIGITARGNGRCGISVGGASRVKIISCVVGDNGVAQVRTEGFCETRIISSNLLENTAPALLQDGGRVSRE
jgi:hypothetical protein